MRAKSVCLAALVGLVGPLASARAQPVADDANPTDDGVAAESSGGVAADSSGDDREAPSTAADNLLFATGLRPIGTRRLEAIAQTGTTTQSASLRTSTTHAGMGLELTGGFDTSDYRVDDTATDTRTARFGGRVTRGKLSAELVGQSTRLHEDFASAGRVAVGTSTVRAHLGYRSGRLRTAGIEHEFAAGLGYVRASGSTSDDDELDTNHMSAPLRATKGEHRFLDAYLRDTVRVIESLDVSTGFIVEKWSYLNGTTALRYGVFDEMELEYPEVNEIEFEPQLGALYRVDDHLALAARVGRDHRAPSLGELYRPILGGDAATAANPALLPEAIWSAEVGPQITAGPIEARAYFYRNEIDRPIASAELPDGTRQRTNLGHGTLTGLVTEASWRPAKAWLATIDYTFAASKLTDAGAGLTGNRLAHTPRNRATATLTYDNPRIATLTGAVRYVGRRYADAANTASLGAYALVDAMAVRRIHGGLAGFIAVENLLDRRYLAGPASLETFGAPRTLHLGLRLDTARF